MEPSTTCTDGVKSEDVKLEDIADGPGAEVSINSKTVVTVELLSFTSCGEFQSTYECDYQQSLTLHTNQGDIEAELSNVITRKYGPFCTPCTS